jgi:hypothetical protein
MDSCHFAANYSHKSCGSVNISFGSGSAHPYSLITDPDPGSEPDPRGQLITRTDSPDPDLQHCYWHKLFCKAVKAVCGTHLEEKLKDHCRVDILLSDSRQPQVRPATQGTV